MRIANLAGRASLVTPEQTRALDVELASAAWFGPGLPAVYGDWERFRAWGATADLSAALPFTADRLGPSSPAPNQIFAVGLNYRGHAAEAGLRVPDSPVVFTKFASSLTGPISRVAPPAAGHSDWEVELVVVIGRKARGVPEAQAWDHVAGLTVGQDISERIGQSAGVNPQYSLAKSHPGFGPTGPWPATTDEFARPDDVELGCLLNGAADLVFSVPALVAYLSSRLTLLPGDLLFTGTPAGVGLGRSPARLLSPGDELGSYIEGIGELHQRFAPEGQV